MRIWHMSDVHLSFNESGEVERPMTERHWSLGTKAYVGYLDRIRTAQHLIDDQDIQIITGDLTHGMPKSKVKPSIQWLVNNLRGTKILIRGNHDEGIDFGQLRAEMSLPGTILLEEGTMQSVGPYLFGCWSDHSKKKQKFSGAEEEPVFYNDPEKLIRFAGELVAMAKEKRKTPILLSHYPVAATTGAELGKIGIKAYLSGHVHVTDNKAPGGIEMKWFDLSAGQTNNKTIEGCYFSTGTTDALLATTGKIIRYINLPKGSKTLPVHHNKPKAPPLTKDPADSMVILVGRPGCGKSTFAEQMAKDGYTIINQDTLGHRWECIKAAEQALSEGKNIVIDRMNFNTTQRKIWIELARKYKVKNISAVIFDAPLEVCIERAVNRKNHPTLKDMTPERIAEIVQKFDIISVCPCLDEGFDDIRTVPCTIQYS